jgi:hypothetical protein
MAMFVAMLAIASIAPLAPAPVGGRVLAQSPDQKYDARIAEESVESARDALSGRGGMPWYDRERDDLRAIHVPPQKAGDMSNRKSKWEDTSKPKPQSTTAAPNFSWTGSFWDALWTIVQVLFWILVVVLVGFLIYLLVKAYVAREDAAAVTSKSQFDFDDGGADENRIESLPFTVARPRGDLLDEARAQYQAGNYRLAVIYLFSYQLIALDRHQHIHLAKGKTNRQYLRELREHPELRAVLEQTMIAFEDVFFGDHDFSRDEFEACWSRVDEFHRHVESQVAV